MARTYVNVIKKGAVVNVPFSTDDIARLQSILLRHLDSQANLDQRSWDTIEEICERIDSCARQQNQTESKEVEF
jgi:hypothetical protein